MKKNSEVSFKGQVKSAFGIHFKEVARCPICHYPLLLKELIADAFPYQHTDVHMECKKCLWTGTFGIPITPLFGMELIIWDSNPLAVLEQAYSMEVPVCPFHLKPMTVTKIWGDKVMDDPSNIRVQWKCPEWFLVHHETVKRASTREIKPLKTVGHVKAKQKVKKRLEQLGYM